MTYILLTLGYISPLETLLFNGCQTIDWRGQA